MTSTPPTSEQLLQALDDDQRQVAEQLSGPLCVLAGAGTGKTRAITYRIANGVAQGVYQPSQVLALTFTARAAGEMRSRLANLGVPGVQARTFHAAALRQLTYFWPNAIGGVCPPIQEHKAPLVGVAARTLGLQVNKDSVRDLAAEVEWAKVTMTSPEHYLEKAAELGREQVAGLEPETVSRLLQTYEEVKADRRTIDFEDVLLLMVGILRDREDIAMRIRQQYRHFVVDEYQDVSPLQQRLLDLWLGPRRRQLCVVGDVSQTIYSFTGATPYFLTHFNQRYEGAKTVRLVRDYRSTPQVVSLANTVLAGRRGGRLGQLPPGAVELVAQQPAGPPVTYMAYDDDVAEANAVAGAIRRLIDSGVSISQIAILYRTNSQSEAFEQALADAQIGYLVRGGEKFFAREEVKRAMIVLRAALREANGDRLDMPEAVREALGREGWTREPIASRGAVRERWESLNALVKLADEIYKARGASLADFVTELAERAATQNAPTVAGVTLSSLHAAKGLEWDAVFLVGVSEGLMPISLSTTEAEIEEEKRLLYVGVTRARKHLHISYARSRSAGGKGSRKYSRFLEGIWPQEAKAERSASKRQASKRTSELFAAEQDAETVALFEALKVWRKQLADEYSRPAYTVFADETLRSIAVVKPKTLKQLLLIRGVGKRRLETYGAQVLALVREHSSS